MRTARERAGQMLAPRDATFSDQLCQEGVLFCAILAALKDIDLPDCIEDHDERTLFDPFSHTTNGQTTTFSEQRRFNDWHTVE